MWVLEHLLEHAASPVIVKAFANDEVIIVLVFPKEGLGQAPRAFRPTQLLGVESTPRLSLEHDSVFKRKPMLVCLDSLCLIHELGKRQHWLRLFVTAFIFSIIVVPLPLLFLDEDLLPVLVNESFFLEGSRQR